MDKMKIKEAYKNMKKIWCSETAPNLRDELTQIIPPLSEAERDQYDFGRFFVPAANDLFKQESFKDFKQQFNIFYKQYLRFKDFIGTKCSSIRDSEEVMTSWELFSKNIEEIAEELELK